MKHVAEKDTYANDLLVSLIINFYSSHYLFNISKYHIEMLVIHLHWRNHKGNSKSITKIGILDENQDAKKKKDGTHVNTKLFICKTMRAIATEDQGG